MRNSRISGIGSNLPQQVRTVPHGSSGLLCDDRRNYSRTHVSLTAERGAVAQSLIYPSLTLRNLADDVRKSHQNQGSLEDQIKVLSAHYWAQTRPRPRGPFLTKRELDNCLKEMNLELDCNLDTAVGNLEEFGALDSFQPEDNPDWYVIRQRDGAFVMGDDFPPAVTDEVQRIISHVQSMDVPRAAIADGGSDPKLNDSGQTLREEIVDKIEAEIEPSELENYLRDGRARERRSKLNEIVEIVKESETFEKPDSYDVIKLVPSALRGHLAEEVLTNYNLA